MSIFNPEEYWEKRLEKDYDLKGVGYYRLGKYYNNWMYKIRRYIFINRMRATNINFSNVDVLDIGSGTGFYIERWKELGVKKIIGTDLTSHAIKKLKYQHPSDEFYQIDIGADIENLKKYNFDIISAFDVLFHIVDDELYENAIKNIYSLLRPGGLFVFSDNFLHQKPIREVHHVSRQLNHIEKILIDNGYEIVERVPMYFLMNFPVDSKSFFFKKLWMIMAKIISKSESLGWLIGAILYPFELICISITKEGPSTEMIICKKP